MLLEKDKNCQKNTGNKFKDNKFVHGLKKSKFKSSSGPKKILLNDLNIYFLMI